MAHVDRPVTASLGHVCVAFTVRACWLMTIEMLLWTIEMLLWLFTCVYGRLSNRCVLAGRPAQEQQACTIRGKKGRLAPDVEIVVLYGGNPEQARHIFKAG